MNDEQKQTLRETLQEYSDADLLEYLAFLESLDAIVADVDLTVASLLLVRNECARRGLPTGGSDGNP